MATSIRKLDDAGVPFFPATTTDAVGHPQCKVSMTDMIQTYNVSTIWPSSSPYTLQTAITKLGEELSAQQKIVGTKVTFLVESGKYETWEFTNIGNLGFTTPSQWFRVDGLLVKEIDNLLHPLDISFTSTVNTIQIGVPTSVKFDWTVSRQGEGRIDPSLYTSSLDSTTVSGNTSTKTLSSNTEGEEIHSLGIQYNYQTDIKSIKINYVYPSYFGKGKNTIPTVLPEPIIKYGKGYTNTVTLEDERIYYIYPASFGNLTSIKDANGFEYINSYTKLTLPYGGVLYNAYVLKEPVTITSFKQIYA